MGNEIRCSDCGNIEFMSLCLCGNCEAKRLSDFIEQKARADAMEKQCSDFVEDVRRCLIILKLNWGTTEGYEKLKEYINEMEAKK